ncbi:uncharacterized protein LOC119072899 [Bradysia coprophila]|uniref:uncharacterized protein LOC119072899 n=1 Tax=Bradysia coprophila TaxID=38358 RepID=UPI00187D9F65|nr:uncharacterized protein LOC119072899 [Bradysia coprophila]
MKPILVFFLVISVLTLTQSQPIDIDDVKNVLVAVGGEQVLDTANEWIGGAKDAVVDFAGSILSQGAEMVGPEVSMQVVSDVMKYVGNEQVQSVASQLYETAADWVWSWFG